MSTDKELSKEIASLLKSDPGLDATHITVTVKNGVVTLSGTVRTFTAKWMAKEAIKHISGIKHIKEELGVSEV
ncbi:MAG: BON domain-containing protein [Alphaproteobacteria bacterium]|nr:BON domain-containing protein [Alphaproteobacteria bacterium]